MPTSSRLECFCSRRKHCVARSGVYRLCVHGLCFHAIVKVEERFHLLLRFWLQQKADPSDFVAMSGAINTDGRAAEPCFTGAVAAFCGSPGPEMLVHS